MSKLQALGDIIDGWPVELGDTLEELIAVPADTVKEVLAVFDDDYAQLVWALRAQARALVQGAEREAALSSPELVERALRDGVLRPKPDNWIIYPLDAKMRRLAAPHKNSGSKYVVQIRSKFPTPDDVPVVEDGGAYLVVWGGDPSVMTIPGVAERINAFATQQRLTDVMFWDDGDRAVWSLRFGVGQDTEHPRKFPDDLQVEKGRKAWL